MKILAALMAMGLLLSSCDKKEPIIQNVQGVMQVSNTGACPVLIRLTAGPTLFPTNPDKLKGFLTDGKQVTVSYREDTEFVSPCSGTEPALIESIR